jgi:hypothetical protein
VQLLPGAVIIELTEKILKGLGVQSSVNQFLVEAAGA